MWILIVDDDSTIREMLDETIRSLHDGITIVHAKHGAHAQNILRMAEKPFRIVITDVNMPHVGGVELIEEIRRTFPETHTILMSGNPEPMGHLAHEFMPKPFGFLEVVQRVAAGLRLLKAV